MSEIQILLDKEASLSNRRYHLLQQIKSLRGTEPPNCWGLDDCSSASLLVCPWRNDCDSTDAIVWQNKKAA